MRIGLALSGGGVKGAAHIGVIKAFEESGIPIVAISGTSMGSIVAALYSMGYTPDEMFALVQYFGKTILKADPKHWISNMKNSRRILGLGALSGESIEIAVQECAKLKQIETINQIKMPIAIPTVNIIDTKKYIFTNQNIEKRYVPGKISEGEYMAHLENEDNNYITDISIGKAVRASSSYPRNICSL